MSQEETLSLPFTATVLQPGATVPTYGTDFAAGIDLYALEDTLLTTKQCLVKTGVHMAIPTGHFGNIRSRSSLAYKHGVCTEAGVIDSDYSGPIGVVMYTLNGEYKITKGDKIAQMIIQPYVTIVPKVVDKLPETVRGQGGFGSTGK
jgi:dUTP pyrophosphatase